MTLLLRLMNSGPLPNGQSTIQMVDGALTVGRGEENDLSLPDPDRMLSKRHCVLEERNGDFVLIDISTNGTFLNYGAERVGTIPTPLNHGDVIQLGPFELVVEIETQATGQGRSDPLPPAEDSLILPQHTSPENTGSNLHDPLDDVNRPWEDVVNDPLGSAAASLTPNSWQPPSASDDPLALGPNASDPFLDLAPEPLQPAPGASFSDHRPAPNDHFPSPAANKPIIPDDWDDLLPGGNEPQAESTPASPFAAAPQSAAMQVNPFGAPPDLPEENLLPPETSASPPEPAPPPAPPAPPPQQPVADRASSAQTAATPATSAAEHATANVAIQAFFAGARAGQLTIPPEELEATMARLGRVFAAMVAGMREILMARASIKSEMRMDRTMIGQGANNPLKFSISPEQAVEAMIRPSVPGYLDAETAATEALNDIRAHEIAMMSGMEAALKDLLARLDPSQLSGRIESSSSLGGLLGGKKARYWEAYEKMYAHIAKETEEDFQSTFGREFTRAYQEQLQKL